MIQATLGSKRCPPTSQYIGSTLMCSFLWCAATYMLLEWYVTIFENYHHMKTVQDERWDKGNIFMSEFGFVWAQCAVLGHWPGAGTQWAIVLILAGGCIGIVWVKVGASGHTMLSLDSSPLVIPLPAGRAPWSQRPSSSSSTFSILQVPIILNWLPNSTYICLDFHLYCKSGSWWWDTFMFLHLA